MNQMTYVGIALAILLIAFAIFLMGVAAIEWSGIRERRGHRP